MLPSPTPAPGPRALASSALKKAGLIEKDAHMKDLTDKPGGRKGVSKTRHHKPRPAEVYKDQGPAAAASRSRTMLSRISHHAGPSDPLAIRGAARPTTVGRLRRGAISGNNSSTVSRAYSGGSVEQWKELVNKRWNKEMHLLNLSGLKDDEVVKKHRLKTPGHAGGESREASILLKLAGKLEPEIKTLDLGGNALTGTHITGISHYLPRLEALNLSNNNLSKADLDMLGRKAKLVHLKELLLLNNPIRDKDYAASGLQMYRREVSRRFPSLNMLDQEPITNISFDAPPTASTSSAPVPKPTATTFPVEMAGSFIAGVDPMLISNFLVRFFQAFDTQRSTLAEVYHPAATFSYQCNTSIPERARIQRFQVTLPNQTKLAWSDLLNSGDVGSRNLSRLGSALDKQTLRLHIGGDAIAQRFLSLPESEHDLTKSADMFALDCFPVPHGGQMALMANVHGQFVEKPSNGIRSFDRTFILVPAPEGSRAKMSNWDVQILSDQWTIRNYSHQEAWQPGPIHVGGPPRPMKLVKNINTRAGTSTMTLPPEQQEALKSVGTEAQRALVLQVCGRTALTVKYAVDCLQVNNWDLDRAITCFHEVRPTLPRDAFLS